MNVFDAIRTRRSVAKLGGDITTAQIEALIEAACCAPNHRRTRPWRFTVVRGIARERLGKVWGQICAQTSTLRDEALAAYVAAEERRTLRAPVIIVVSTRTDSDPIVAMEDFAASAAAVQNILLAACESGLDTIWRTGPMAIHPRIHDHLELSPSDRIVAFVYVGVAIEKIVSDPQRSSAGFVRWVE